MRLAPGARRAGRRGVRLWRVRRRLPGAPASRGVEGDRAAAPARSRRGRCSPSSPRRRSPPAPSTTTSSRSPTSACCSRTSRRSPTRSRWSRPASGSCPASNMSRCRRREVPLADAIRSYLFNAQLVTLPDGENGADRADRSARDAVGLGAGSRRHVAGNGPIRRVEVVDVRQSMANGGGPACLRLRVVADPATVDPRFLVDEAQARPDRRRDRPALARADPQ